MRCQKASGGGEQWRLFLNKNSGDSGVLLKGMQFAQEISVGNKRPRQAVERENK